MPLTYSGPLSQRISLGQPRHSMMFSRARITRSDGKEKINLNAEPFTVKVVQDIQEADTAAILKLVVHEVHRPYLIHGFRNSQLFRLVPLSPFPGLYPQVQFKLPVNAVHALVVPDVTRDVTQKQKAQAKSPVAMSLGEVQKQFCNSGIVVHELRLISKAAFTDAERRARLPDAYFFLIHGFFGHLRTQR